MQKSSNILHFLQDLCIVGHFNKLDQLFKNLFNILNLSCIAIDQLLLVHESLLLPLVFPLEAYNYILLLFLQFPDQFRKAVLDVAYLDLHESF